MLPQVRLNKQELEIDFKFINTLLFVEFVMISNKRLRRLSELDKNHIINQF